MLWLTVFCLTLYHISEQVVDAWFTLGHLGGYNALNLQVVLYSIILLSQEASFRLYHRNTHLIVLALKAVAYLRLHIKHLCVTT